MLNVSWAKKRAEFVFVFAIREGEEGRGKMEERREGRGKRGNMIDNIIQNKEKDGMRLNVRGILREQE